MLPLLASFFAWSCEDVLQLDLSDVHNQVVIEGIVSITPSSSSIKVSLTRNSFDNTQAPKVSGAVVTLSDDQGVTEVVTESPAGVFVPSVITGSPGRTYHLRVVAAGLEFTADSKMPSPMSLDSIRYTKSTSWFTYNSTVLKYYLTDTPAVDEYCLIRAYSQNSSSFVWTIYSDKYTDGGHVVLESPAFTPTSSTVVVEVLSVDKATYEYFYSLRDLLGDNISIPDMLRMTDYNPKSNLTNNALGYFSAQAQSRYIVTIK
jgi:hypothetical protein